MRDIEKIIRALNSPIRREIVSLVWNRELAAGEIAGTFEVTKPTVSQHLAVLRDAGLVTVTVAGTSRRYRARKDALSGLYGLLDDPGKWTAADDVPERALAEVRTAPVVVATVDVDVDPPTAFVAFTDETVYSRWLGVPVRIVDGDFSCTLEWGTNVRGRYEIVVPDELIVMRWDFDDDRIPLPGNEMTGYLRVHPGPNGSGARVEVHQIVEDRAQAEFMELAWTTVLGRFKAGVVAASERERPAVPRPRRRKRRQSA